MVTSREQTRRAHQANKQRGRARREAILEAAAALYSKTGSRGTGLAAVGKAAGVTHSAVLYHFGSADELMLAVLEWRDRRDELAFHEMFELGGVEGFRRLPEVAVATERAPGLAKLFLVLATESLDENHYAHTFFVRRYRRLRKAFVRMLERGQERGEIHRALDLSVVASRIIAFMDGATLQRALDPARVDLLAVYQNFTHALIAEIRATEGDA